METNYSLAHLGKRERKHQRNSASHDHDIIGVAREASRMTTATATATWSGQGRSSYGSWPGHRKEAGLSEQYDTSYLQLPQYGGTICA